MKSPRHIAVIDIGKTNVKLALVDLTTVSEIAVVTRPNVVRPGPPWPHFDAEGHWAFLLDALGQFHRDYGIDAISVTTHGASIVLLDENGDLAAPILDYEHDGLAETAAQYDAIRPPFEQTGSPRLANGLNVGAQLHWQFQADPELHARTAHILTYPQYWSHRLTGVVANDVTSMGCHTDLWRPLQGEFSDLVETLDISDKIAPVRKSTDILGPVLPKIATATGLPKGTPVICGIHDSNASLYSHVLTQKTPFSVVSTGTWVVVMAMGGTETVLDPSRDTLINVNALGEAVPSGRFMGGREFEQIQKGHPVEISPADVEWVLDQEIMLLPAVDPLSGPYQGMEMRWHGAYPSEGSGFRAVALSYYLALMTDTCLRLTGADGPIIVEGPFAHNAQYLAMLQAATGRPVLQSLSSTGTSIGAALLFVSDIEASKSKSIEAPETTLQMVAYAAQWRLRVERDLA
ncbi:FGGY-family carbohydrate kinase [Parasedimentitalea psychrophila]|uniref:FGGY-family carbohydrate kinase n=1 Tax=Parasedimentitalea psychrophila TaxID=2997337 RepID=A0A9Y2KZ63_9RHOB|nr:FGGY-family carbohydrate kinase [Parasedimentitalea psychrophila]WIY24442.1 FGGY-family carbohydrate kinase [Parasedimentitalea psychrophila]